MNFKKYHVSKNLFSASITQGVWAGNTGTSPYVSPSTRRICTSNIINLDSAKTYTIALRQPDMYVVVKTLDSNGNIVSDSGWKSSVTFSNSYGIVATFRFSNESDISPQDFMGAMLNEGSTPLPYEPYSSEVWHDIPHYIHNTATDTITTLPVDVYADGNNATVGISGNTVQNGTPTPQNPIQPSECGERTGNLFPLDESKLHVGRIENDGTIDYEIGTLTVGTDSVTYEANVAWRGFYTDFIQVNGNEKVTFSPHNSSIMSWACKCYDENGGFLGNAFAQPTTSIVTFTLLTGTRKVRMSVTSSNTTYTILRPMLNLGSTAIPYEPYGVKIPILSASITTPVYLGEVQSTRRIKKLVLTGEENWMLSTAWKSTNTSVFYTTVSGANNQDNDVRYVVSDRFISASRNEVYSGDTDMIGLSSRNALTVRISDNIATTLTEFQTYLSTQYANGTPVTIWYVLATPQTAVVNEPIRKIGDYADTVSGISIPTIAGANSFDVLTTLKPSEVTVNYKGWHTGAVHERENGAWT